MSLHKMVITILERISFSFFSIKKYIHIIFLNRKESIPKEFGGFLSIFCTEITVQNL
jgi:hypothetical protein